LVGWLIVWLVGWFFVCLSCLVFLVLELFTHSTPAFASHITLQTTSGSLPSRGDKADHQ